MNTTSKRIASGGISVALVGGIIAGAIALGPAFASSPAPQPAETVDVTTGSVELEEFREKVDAAIAAKAAADEAARVEAERVEAERVAAEAAAAEAARVEAERVAAEQAAAEQAQRQAPAAPAPQQPAAPAPAPAEPAQPGGDQQAGECNAYDDTDGDGLANECVGWYVP